MILTVRNVWTLVEGTEQEREFIDGYLTFRDESAPFTPAFRAHRWDGKYKLFDRKKNQFPSGFANLVKTAAEKLGFKIHWGVQDPNTPPLEFAGTVSLSWLRDYQLEVVQSCLQAGRGVVKSPTGSGKSEMFIALGQLIPSRWLILAHKKDLLRQTADRFKLRTGEEAGIIGDGIYQPARWTVATIQSIARLLPTPAMQSYLHSVEGVVVDECHTVASLSYTKVLQEMGNAYWRFGFSGTPMDRADKKFVYVIGSLGEIIHKIPAEKLVDDGILSRPTIRFVPVQQKTDWDSWPQAYDLGIVHSKPRNESVVRVVALAAKPALLFVKNIVHGQLLLAALRREDARAEFVWGDNFSQERAAAIKRLQRGDLDVLVCSSIFEEGIDIPEIEAIIVASGGKSTVKTLQRLGRGMRVTKDKNTVELWDFMDIGSHWLARHARKRKADFQAESYDVIDYPLPLIESK